MLKRLLISVVALVICKSMFSQTLGGNAVFNFLKQPNSPEVAALGGVNISNISNDVSLAFHNPSLLRSEMHEQVNASFNSFLAGIKNYSLTTAYFSKSIETNFALGINYFNYGNIAETDAAGNELGSMHPSDYVVEVIASKKYKDNWFYGTTLKFINSSYGAYKSNGIAVDVGVSFYDTIRKFQASVVVKNIGTQLKTYDGTSQKEELPFDLQAGITKRLEKAPIQFSLTAHSLHRFNIFYSDTAFLGEQGQDDFRGKKFTLDKVMSHLIVAVQFFVKDKVEISAGYNFLRRKDLNVLNAANGFNGFTMGGGLLLKYLQVRYATGLYQQKMFNQLGVNFAWK
jgi:hypothetical protein